MRLRKSTLIQDLLPQLTIELPDNAPLDPRSLFDFKPRALWLEIGFGAGEHLAAQAKSNLDVAMIGCEPFVNGVAGLLDHIDRAQLRNIRIYPDDARPLLAALPPQCLDRVFILFADPWPKKRHADRRFVQTETLQSLARVMHSGAELLLATDDPVLQEWMTEQMMATQDFTPISENGISITQPDHWVPTRYEAKAIEAGRTPLYFCFRRR